MENKQMIVGTSMVLVVIAALFFITDPAIMGAIIIEDQGVYSHSINMTFEGNTSYEWTPVNHNVKSVKVSGTVFGNGTARVYLIAGPKKYLVFDSERIKPEKENLVTGNAVADIASTLSYGDNQYHDTDNDGIETTEGIVDLEVTADVSLLDTHRLCTKWEVLNVIEETVTSICHGNSSCCAFIDLQSSAEAWNDTYYASYGRDNAGYDNRVSAQVIYYDVDETKVTIKSSGFSSVPVQFYPAITHFTEACVDTCSIPTLTQDSYRLEIVTEHASIFIQEIVYTAKKKNEMPVRIRNISNIVIDEQYTINLAKYFVDDSALRYEAYDADNITVVIRGDKATLIPDTGYTGVRYMFFTAYDSEYGAVSNVFMVNVTEDAIEEIVQMKAVTGKPVKWVKKTKDTTVALPEKASLVALKQVGDYYEVTYETEAPNVNETVISENRKIVSVSANMSYQDVLTTTRIPESPKRMIRLYWMIEGKRVDVTTDAQVNLTFIDTNSNGLIDVLEWNVPHLSTQTFEVVIYETSAWNGTHVHSRDDGENITLNSSDSEQELTNFGAYDGYVNMTGNVLLMHFNNDSSYGENDSLVFDFSGNGNNGSCTNCPVWNASGKLSGGFEYSSSADYFIVPNNASIDLGRYDNGTIIAWIRTTKTSKATIVSMVQSGDPYDGWVVDVNENSNNNKLCLWTGTGTSWVCGNSDVNDGTWKHIAVTFDQSDSSATFYLNGETDGSQSIDTIESVSYDLWIGYEHATSADYVGAIDELSLWNRSLSSSEIKAIYNRQKGVYIDRAHYISEVYDAGQSAIWSNLRWQALGWINDTDAELPNNQADETYANMTGNVLLMHFNNQSEYGENATHFYDFSGNQNNGTGTNFDSDEIVLGRFNKGINIGSNDHIVLNEPSATETNIANGTVSAWIKTGNAGSGYRGIVVKQQAYGMFLNANVFGLYDWNTDSWRPSGISLDDDKWHHVAFTFRSSVAGGSIMYIDGESVATSTITVNNQNEGIVIGAGNNPASAQYFTGNIDEVAIWNRTLSPQEIAHIYQRGLLRLNVQTRTSDDNVTWSAWSGNHSNPSGTINGSVRYLQYKVLLSTENVSYTPFLNWINVSYLIDNSAPGVNFTSPTPVNNSIVNVNHTSVNVSIMNASDLGEFTFNWNGTNYTHYDDSLVLMMNFDNVSSIGDSSTKTVDISTYSNNGTWNGGQDSDSGWNCSDSVYGCSVMFDGSGDYVLISDDDALDGTDTLSIELWFRSNSAISSAHGLISKRVAADNQQSYSIFTWTDNNGLNVDIDGYGDRIDVGWAPIVGTWYHFVVVYDGTLAVDERVKIYVNSKLNKTASETSTSIPNYASDLHIGALHVGSSYFDGMIDEVKIYNRTMNISEIEQQYYSNLQKYAPDKWQFITNQSNLTDGTYTYHAFASDTAHNWNQTEERTIVVDITYPGINYTEPTPANASIIYVNNTIINITVSGAANITSLIWSWDGINYTLYDENLVLLMNFDNATSIGETDSKAVDVSTYANNATFRTTNEPTWNCSDAKYGCSLEFDGSNDYVTLDKSYDFSANDEFSVSVWINPKETNPADDYATIIRDKPTDSFFMNYDGSNPYMRFRVYSSGSSQTATTDSSLTAGMWWHLVGVYNASHVMIYVNGNMEDIQTFTQGVRAGTTFNLGYADNKDYYKGLMDAVSIYNRSLSTDEIKQLYYSNLYKYDTDKWQLTVYPENVTDGTYLYQAYIMNGIGYQNETDAQTITFDMFPITVYYTSPTEENNSILTVNYTTVNMSISNASDLALFTFNWNSTNYTFYDDSLVLMYNFDNRSSLGENGSIVVDTSRENHTSTVYNTAEPNSTGTYGKSYWFDGNSDYIEIPYNESLNPPKFTLSLWAKVTGGAGSYRSPITSRYNSPASGYMIYAADDNTWKFWIGDGSGWRDVAGKGVTLQEWIYLTAVYNGSHSIFYNDGKLAGGPTAYTLAQNTESPTRIAAGATEGSPTFYFVGQIDEVRIYNRSMDATEVWMHYVSNLAQYDTHEWKFISEQFNLTDDSYYYQGFVTETTGDQRYSEERIVMIDAVDTVYPAINFTLPTPANNSIINVNHTTINISIDNVSDLKEFKWNWNGMNYTFYDDSLVLMMNFENVSSLGEDDNFVKDLSNHNNNGTISGASNDPYFNSTGRYKGAIQLDGDQDMVSSDGYFIPPPYNFTLAAWVKTSADAGIMGWSSTSDGHGSTNDRQLYISSGLANFRVWDGNSELATANAGNIITDGEWHHIVGILNDASNIYLYVDGVLQDDAEPIDSWAYNSYSSGSAYLAIGVEATTDTHLTGMIDEVRIYNRSLSSDEVKQLYYSNLNKYAPDKWQFVTNQSNLTDGTYTYQAFVKDDYDNMNETEERTLSVDLYPIKANFTAPTPENNSIVNVNHTSINVSLTNVSDLDNFTFNWNGTNYTFYDDSLVLMMNFDNVSILGDNDSQAVDVSKYGNNGTFKGTLEPHWNCSNAKYGCALEFDGSDDYVEVGDDSSLNITGAITISAWIKTSSASRGGIFDKLESGGSYNGYTFVMAQDDAGKLDFYSPNIGWVDSNTALNDGNWHHIVVTGSGSNGYFYYDGKQDGNFTYAALTTNAIDPKIGKDYNNAEFKGTIDEVRIWNRTLSADEVYQHYISNLNKYAPDKWFFVTNQSNLIDGTYTYQAFAEDTSGNVNSTEERIVIINTTVVDTEAPGINFTAPTPENNSIVNVNHTSINVSLTNVSDLDNFTFNWNGTNYTFYDDSLVLMYNFNNMSILGENDSHISDLSLSGDNATAYSDANPEQSDSISGGSYYFDGVDNGKAKIQVVSPVASNIIKNITISLWVKRLNNGAIILSNGDSSGADYQIYIHTDNKIRFAVNSDWGNSAWGSVLDTNWHHIVSVYDGTNPVIYVDGNRSGVGATSGDINNNNEHIAIGGRYDDGNYPFEGYMDEIYIYNRSLSHQQVKQLYYSNLQKYDTDKWQFVTNQSNLTDGTYTYQAYARDNVGNVNSTEERIVMIDAVDTAAPGINFTAPTPGNNSIVNVNHTTINVSITNASDLDNFTFNWNGTNYTLYDDSLVLMMNFDNVSSLGENDSFVRDLSGNEKNAVCAGTTCPSYNLSGGRFSGAIQLDGSNDYFEVNISDRLDGGIFTMAFWVRPEAWTGNWYNLVGKTEGSDFSYMIYVDTDGTHFIRPHIKQSDGTTISFDSTTTTTTDNWYHVVQTADGTNMRLYINGIEDASSPLAYDGTVKNVDGSLYIGKDTREEGFDGKLDEVRIYNRSLSAEEIKQLYYSNLYKYAPDKWLFVTNQSNLSDGSYTYQAFARDNVGNVNSTEERIVIIDTVPETTPPGINFTAPTPENNSIVNVNHTTVNVSLTNASDLGEFKFNWNSTNYTFYDDSLVLMMNFDNVSAIGENDSQAVDVSKYSNNGTFKGTLEPKWNCTEAKYGCALEFDGSDDYVNTTDINEIDSAQKLTFSFWMKAYSLSDYDGIIQKYVDIYDRVTIQLSGASNTDNDDLQFTIGDGAAANAGHTDITNLISINTWYNVVWVFDGTQSGDSNRLKLYLDGGQKTLSFTGTIPNSVTDLGSSTITIGNDFHAAGRFFNGLVDEVRIYNHSLSLTEVKQLYYSNLAKYDQDKWQFVTNQSNLTDGTYTYQAYARDNVGNVNSTEERTLTVDLYPIKANFTAPTPVNNSIVNVNHTSVNVSIMNASDLGEFTFNWNGTNYTHYDDSLVLMMNFDNVSAIGENSSIVVDVSKYGNNGTWYGDIDADSGPLAQAKYAGSFMFDGTGDYFNISHTKSMNSSKGLTLSAWIKTTQAGVLFSKDESGIDPFDNTPGYTLYLRSSDPYLRMTVEDNGGDFAHQDSCPTDPKDGEWHHVIGMWDRSNKRVSSYIDGELQGTTTNSNMDDISNDKELFIGMMIQDSTQQVYFNGQMDEIRIFNRTLSVEEIEQLYYANLNKYDTDKWQFVTNQSNLTDGTYTYQAFAEDTSTNINQTEERTVTIDTTVPDTTAPSINFTFPTPANNSILSVNHTTINISIDNASDLQDFKWNWNNTNYTLYDDSLVLMMNFDNVSILGENDSQAVDVSKYGNNGTFKGTLEPKWNCTDAKYGCALEFDGSDDYISLDSHVSDFQDLAQGTISLWYKSDANAIQRLFSAADKSDPSNDIAITLLDSAQDNRLEFVVREQGNILRILTQSQGYDDGIWHYVVVTVNSSGNNMYIDGIDAPVTYEDGSASTQAFFDDVNDIDVLRIGNNQDSGGNQYSTNGFIDQVIVWNYSFSSWQVKQLYYSNLQKYDTDKWLFVTNQSNLTDGTYTYKAYAQDKAGNVNETEERTVVIDTTVADTIPPGINFTSPTPGNNSIVNVNHTTVNVSILNASDLSEFKWNWNGTNYTFYDDSLVLMMNFDNNSDIGENSTNVVDMSVTSHNGTPKGNAHLNTSHVRYGASFDFDGSLDYINLSRYNYSIVEDFTIETWAYVREFPGSGRYGMVSIMRDLTSGGGSDRSGVTFGIGSSGTLYCGASNPPSSYNDIYSTDTITLNEWYHIVLTVDSADVVFYINTIKDDASNLGSAVLDFTDADGSFTGLGCSGRNGAASDCYNGLLDSVRVYNRVLTQDEIIQHYYANLNKYDTDKWQFVTNQSNLIDGTYTYQAFARDTSGNVNQTEERTVIINTTLPENPPNITSYYPLTNISISEPENKTFNITFTNESRVTIRWFEDNFLQTNYTNSSGFNWTGNYSQEGSYIIFVNVSNTVGSSTHTWNLTVNDTDNIAPNVSIETINRSWYNTGTPTIYFNITDDTDPVLNYTVYVNNVNDTTGYVDSGIANQQVTLSALTNGTHTVYIEAYDDNNNYKNSSTITLYIDTVEPSFTLHFPQDDYNTSSDSINLNWTVTDNMAESLLCNVTINGTVNSTLDGANGSSTNYTVTGIPEGTHLWNITCVDNATNTNTSITRAFTVDRSPPVVMLDSPRNNTWNNTESINLTYQASDSYTSIVNCSLIFDGARNESDISSMFSLINITEGRHNWSVNCTDSTGNRGSSEERIIVIDRILPGVTLHGPQNYHNTSSANVMFNWSVTDESSTLSCNITINRSVYDTVSVPNGTWVNITAYTLNGTYKWNVTCIDNATNKGRSETRSLTVDTSLPEITLIHPGHNTTNTSKLFRYIVTDTHTTVSNCTIMFNSSINKTNTSLSAGTHLFRIPALTNGVHEWNITCVDSVGNIGYSDTYMYTLTSPTQIVPQEPGAGGDGGGDGGGGGGGFPEPEQEAYECYNDSECKKGFSCYNHACVKLFDVKIIRADSPVQQGEYLDFTYFIKGMAEIKGDVIVEFWVEKDGKIIVSGTDTVYLGVFEEKTDTANMYLPESIMNGTYELYVMVDYLGYEARAHRNIEIVNTAPLAIDITLLAIAESTSLEDFYFKALLASNKDVPYAFNLQQIIVKDNTVVWSKEQEVSITKSEAITEHVGTLAPGTYSLQLIGYYGNKKVSLYREFEIVEEKVMLSPSQYYQYMKSLVIKHIQEILYLIILLLLVTTIILTGVSYVHYRDRRKYVMLYQPIGYEVWYKRIMHALLKPFTLFFKYISTFVISVFRVLYNILSYTELKKRYRNMKLRKLEKKYVQIKTRVQRYDIPVVSKKMTPKEAGVQAYLAQFNASLEKIEHRIQRKDTIGARKAYEDLKKTYYGSIRNNIRITGRRICEQKLSLALQNIRNMK